MQKIVEISFDQEKGQYSVVAGEGSSVEECIFACSVLARIFKREGFIESLKEFEDKIHKYLTDSQYDEVESKENATAIESEATETKEESTDGEQIG